MSEIYDTALAAVAGRHSGGALAHSRGVSETAAAIADIYGVDRDDARIAGLLHDWDRDVEGAALLSAARDYDIEVTESDRVVPYLLHARTGAAAARVAVPGLSDEVVSAIERHTVGAEDMSPLDMVVYIADMIEPGRIYAGVDDLREIVGSVSLETLFARCYEHTLRYLIDARRPIHPQTVAVWNALVRGGAL